MLWIGVAHDVWAGALIAGLGVGLLVGVSKLLDLRATARTRALMANPRPVAAAPRSSRRRRRRVVPTGRRAGRPRVARAASPDDGALRSTTAGASVFELPATQRVRRTSATERHQSPGDRPVEPLGVAVSQRAPVGAPLAPASVCRSADSRSQRVPSAGRRGPNSQATAVSLTRTSSSGAMRAVRAARVRLVH